MSYANQVAIGPEFFAKAFNDYADWYWAIARELCQNSIDAGSKNINVQIYKAGEDTILTVTNDGSPMTEEIITNKLLALGGSGKNFSAGNVGGFGKAKEIIYFCHSSYSIQTGKIIVEGSGAGYNISEAATPFNGTKSTIVIKGHHSSPLVLAFEAFSLYAQWDGELTINGEYRTTCLRKGSPRRELSCGTVYTNKSFKNTVIVRINGIPMFHNHTSLDRCVIVELKGSSVDCLTSNRDGLTSTYRHELSEFLTSLSVDKRSALKNRMQTRYRRYGGDRLSHRAHSGINVQQLVAVADSTDAGFDTSVGGVQSVMVRGVAAAVSCSSISEEFIIKNETELAIPNYYLPDSRSFSTYSKKLAKVWGRLMLEMHRLFDKEGDFAIGFVFDDQVEAEWESGQFGTVYYINPAQIVEQSNSNSKSFKKRFALTERNRLLMLALHEFVHGCGCQYHDENYANKLTHMAVKVLDQKKRFTWCFA
jgi:hypothetical protein